MVFTIAGPLSGSMRGRKKKREGCQTLKSDLTENFSTSGTVWHLPVLCTPKGNVHQICLQNHAFELSSLIQVPYPIH